MTIFSGLMSPCVKKDKKRGVLMVGGVVVLSIEMGVGCRVMSI